jgi:hypothetical protein
MANWYPFLETSPGFGVRVIVFFAPFGTFRLIQQIKEHLFLYLAGMFPIEFDFVNAFIIDPVYNRIDNGHALK